MGNNTDNKFPPYLNFLAKTWLQLPGAAHRSTTFFTPATDVNKWQSFRCI